MGRKRQTYSPPKSQVKSLFSERCPGFKNVFPFNDVRKLKALYVWRDTIQCLYIGPYHGDKNLVNDYDKNGNIIQVPRNRYIKDLVCNLKSNTEKFLENSNVFIHSFDKFKYVPIAKGQIEAIRDSKNEKEKEEIPDPEEPEIATVIDKNWIHYISDRKGFRQKVIRVMCKSLISSPYSIELPRGKTVVFDGHCLMLKDLIELDIKYDGIKPSEIEITPIVIKNENGIMKRYLDKRFQNTVGEADFQCYFYHKKMMELTKSEFNFIAYSNDTDIINLGLAYYEKLNVLGHSTKGYNIYNITKITDNETDCFDINYGYEYIVNYSKLAVVDKLFINQSKINAPVFSYLACIISGGSDYTISHYLVPIKHFFNTYWQGDLENLVNLDVENGNIEVKLNGVKYLDMLVRVYCLSGKKPYQAKDAKDSVAIDILKNKVNSASPFPSTRDTIACTFQLYYYLLLIAQLGNKSLNEYEKNLGDFECRKLDASKGWEKDNIERNIYDEKNELVTK